jgi:hypothetical protein
MNDTQHNSTSAIRHKVECRDLFLVVLNIIMLSVVMLNVILLSVFMLSVAIYSLLC